MFDNADNEIHENPEDAIQRTTEWHNPTLDQIVLEIHVQTPGKNSRRPNKANGDKPLTFRERTGNLRYVIKSMESVTIPSEYDQAIQRVRDGVIVSGLAPQLKNMGRKDVVKVHDALNSALQEKLKAKSEAQIAYGEKAEAEAKLAVAQAELAKLQAIASAEAKAVEKATGGQSSFIEPPKPKKE
jgi:hypothetical protein